MEVCSGRGRIFLFILLIFFIPFLFTVIELNKNLTAEDLVQSHRKKPDHLVLGHAAGQGLRDRLQCQGTKALNKMHFSNSSQSSNLAESITFVTVFTIYGSSMNMHVEDRSTNFITVGKVSYGKAERSMALLNVFLNFIQVTMPQSSVVILTDPASDLSLHRNNVTLYPIKGEYSRAKLMLQRIKSYIAFLEDRLDEHSKGHKEVRHYIFTDSDIAVVDDLGRIFYDYPHFHVAFTFRNNKNQPLNSGFVAVRGTADGILRAKVFLENVLEVYNTKYMNASRMLGDQLALAWIVKSWLSFDVNRFTKPEAFIEEISGTTVLFLPCAMYNWTPPEGAGQFHGMPLGVKVVHFKGTRKRLMLEAWNFFTSSSDMSAMLCLILQSGRTKFCA